MTNQLTSIEVVLIERLFQSTTVAELMTLVIHNFVNEKDILLPNKMLATKLNFKEQQSTEYGKDKKICISSDLYGIEQASMVGILSNNILSFAKQSPNDFNKSILIPLIYELRRKISCFDPFILDITDTSPKIISSLSFLYNPEILSRILDNLHEPVETFISSIINSNSPDIVPDYNIYIVVYTTLLLFYVRACYNKAYIEYIREYFADCMTQKKIGFIRYSLQGCGVGHAVAIIFNGLTKVVEYFDPNGDTPQYGSQYMSQFFRKILGPLFIRFTIFHPMYVTKDDYQIKYSLQTNTKGLNADQFDEGICGLYTTWFLFQRLRKLQSYAYKGIPQDKYMEKSRKEYKRYADFYASKVKLYPKGLLTKTIDDYRWRNAPPNLDINDINVNIDRHYDILRFGASMLECVQFKPDAKDDNKPPSIWSLSADIRKKHANAKSKSELGMTIGPDGEYEKSVIYREVETFVKDINARISCEFLHKCVSKSEPIKDANIYLFNEIARFNQRVYLAYEDINISNLHNKEHFNTGFKLKDTNEESTDNFLFYLTHELRLFENIFSDH